MKKMPNWAMISSHVVIISPMAEAGPLGARQLRVVLGAHGRGGRGELAGGRPGAQRHGTGCQVDPVGPPCALLGVEDGDGKMFFIYDVYECRKMMHVRL